MSPLFDDPHVLEAKKLLIKALNQSKRKLQRYVLLIRHSEKATRRL